MGRRIKKAAIIACVLLLLLVIVVGVARSLFTLTSTNAVIYLMRDSRGGLRVTSHLKPGDPDTVWHMIDVSCLFNVFAKTQAALGQGNIELTWNAREGDGVIKEFRPDGTEFLVVLARYANDNGTPQGLFIGGDLPLGDTQAIVDKSKNNTGIAFYDGTRWNHIWCALNEAVTFTGNGPVINTENWQYLGSTVLKSTVSEVVIESRHAIDVLSRNGIPVRLSMKRTLQKRLGEDYVILKVEFMNQGEVPFSYSWEFGDEPWVGDFYRGSKGNVGWTDGELFKYEGYVPTANHTFAGFWDIGNDVIHENARFTGYADFAEWLSSPPTFVYFANKFGFDDVDVRKPLSSWNNRVVSLLWLNQELQPGEINEHVVALGMAKPGDRAAGVFFPVKPVVRRP
jgi:hypothetical protein